MTKEELKLKLEQEEGRIHNKIRKIYPKSAGLDGILNVDKFFDITNPKTSPLKLLWILKERGYPLNKPDQEFILKDYMNHLAQNKKWSRTFSKLCYVTEGILEWQYHNDLEYLDFNNLPKLQVIEDNQEVCYYRNENELIFPLDYIAFLNVKKLGSHNNRSNPKDIDSEYKKTEIREIIKEQVDYIKPDIIISGNRVASLSEDLAGCPFSNFSQNGISKYYFNNNQKRLHIFTYHPAFIMPRIEYCNSIFEIIKQYSSYIRKS